MHMRTNSSGIDSQEHQQNYSTFVIPDTSHYIITRLCMGSFVCQLYCCDSSRYSLLANTECERSKLAAVDWGGQGDTTEDTKDRQDHKLAI